MRTNTNGSNRIDAAERRGRMDAPIPHAYQQSPAAGDPVEPEEDASLEALYGQALAAIRLLGGTHLPPHPKRVVAYARSIMCISREFSLLWYGEMTAQGWLDLDGRPIRNWTYMLRAWKNGEAYYKAKQALLAAEASRLSGIAKQGGSRRAGPVRHADNWIGTPADRIENVF